MAEVARWGTPAFRITWVGVSYLMSAVALSHGLRQLMCARRGMCFASRVLPIIIFFSKLLGSSGTEKDKFRNAQLPH